MRYVRGCLLVVLAWSLGAAQVRPTTTWIDYYSAASTMNGVPIPVGAVIQAFDPGGTLCGEFTVQNAGSYGYLHVYGDDPTTSGIDEGAIDGDTITFFIEGKEATGQAVWTASRIRDTTERHLHVTLPPPDPPAAEDPAGNEPSVSGPVVLSWSASGPTVGTTTYQIQISLDSLFTTIIVDTTGITGTSVTLDILSGGTQYYWRVRTINSITGEGSYEPGPTFTTSVSAELTASAATIDLGESAVGATSTGTFYVRNPSTVDVIVTSIGVSTARFTVSPTNATVSAGDSLAVGVTYQPDAFGLHADTVVILSNAETNLLVVPVRGISPRPVLAVNPASIDFGSTSGDSAVVYLVSTSVNAVTVDTIFVGTRYYGLQLPSFPAVVASMETLTVRVFFSPDSIRDFPDTVYVRDNTLTDGGSVTSRVSVTGRGTIVTHADTDPGVPAVFWVGQNFPNPFNPMTTFEFTLPAKSIVKISVYTLLGQRVTTLLSGLLPSGIHRQSFDGNALPSGIYLYTVSAQAEDGTGEVYFSVRRMVLLK